MIFIKKILYEANYENDTKTVNLAKKYISKIKEYLDTFDGEPNNVVDCYFNKGYIIVKLGDLTVILMDARHYKGSSGGYIDNKIVSHNAKFKFDKENKKLTYQFNESNLLHELIHYFDNKRVKNKEDFKKAGEKKERGRADSNYFNNPYEFNANFLQTVFPRVENIIKDNILPTSFEEFKKIIFKSNYRLKDFYYYLTDENKKKLLKRLYNIFSGINKISFDTLKDENFENLPNYSKKQKLTFIQHLKNLVLKTV